MVNRTEELYQSKFLVVLL